MELHAIGIDLAKTVFHLTTDAWPSTSSLTLGRTRATTSMQKPSPKQYSSQRCASCRSKPRSIWIYWASIRAEGSSFAKSVLVLSYWYTPPTHASTRSGWRRAVDRIFSGEPCELKVTTF
jgi:hypothetical protein